MKRDDDAAAADTATASDADDADDADDGVIVFAPRQLMDVVDRTMFASC